MDFTTDKLRSLVRKWQSLIESHVDVKTTDNYMLRIFCIGFTKKRPNQIKRTCYAQSSQIRQVFVSTLSSRPYTTWVSGWPIYLANVVCSGVLHSHVGASFSFWGARSGERWVKSWCVKPKVVTWRSWWPSLFQRWLERKLRRQHLVSILSRILTSAKWRFWKLPSLTLLSLWRWVCFTFYHTFLYLDIDIFCNFSWTSPKGLADVMIEFPSCSHKYDRISKFHTTVCLKLLPDIFVDTSTPNIVEISL